MGKVVKREVKQARLDFLFHWESKQGLEKGPRLSNFYARGASESSTRIATLEAD